MKTSADHPARLGETGCLKGCWRLVRDLDDLGRAGDARRRSRRAWLTRGLTSSLRLVCVEGRGNIPRWKRWAGPPLSSSLPE